MSKNVKKIAIGATLAGLAGYVAGILTAPKSGKDTRRDIGDAAAKAKSEAEKQLKALHSELDSLIRKASDKAGKLKSTAKKELDTIISMAKTNKEKARDILSALHEGGADDKELKKAVKDANKAVEHLKKYLAKNA